MSFRFETPFESSGGRSRTRNSIERGKEKEGRDLICKLFTSIGFAFPSLSVALRMSDVHPNTDCKMSGARSKGAYAPLKAGRGRVRTDGASLASLHLTHCSFAFSSCPLIRVPDVSHPIHMNIIVVTCYHNL